MLIEKIPLWLAETNAYLVAPDGPGGECVLVDAPPDPSAILDRLQFHGLRLVALLATHGHIDHVGGVKEVVKAQDHSVPVHIHELDRHMLLDPRGTSGSFGQYLGDLDVSAPELIEGLDDGQVVRGAGMKFTCLHTPGHTWVRYAYALTWMTLRPSCSVGTISLPGPSVVRTWPEDRFRR